ncbi:MAG: Carboxypeptidase regulatory-like domain, partial [Thermoleophilaceae bacterium]|nr:Carboxypeptidase regulatory-like domain [Thermoleophilaceae bacterium]
MSAPRGRRRFLVAAVAAAGLLAPASALAANGSITGAVTANGTGNPVFGMKVAAHTVGGAAVKSTCSDAGGAYTIDDLVPGPYVVLFSVDTVACPGGPTDYAPRRYNALGGSSLRQFADPVTVPDGGPVTASTAVRLGARIAGAVKEQATGTGLANVTVEVLNEGLPI